MDEKRLKLWDLHQKVHNKKCLHYSGSWVLQRKKKRKKNCPKWCIVNGWQFLGLFHLVETKNT